MSNLYFRRFGKNFYASESYGFVRVNVYDGPVGTGGNVVDTQEFNRVYRYGFFTATDFNAKDREAFGIKDNGETYFALWDHNGKHVFGMTYADILITEAEA